MIAVKVAESLIMKLVTCPDNAVLEAKEALEEAVVIEAHNPQTCEDEFFVIERLHHERDCWNVDHLAGYIMIDTGVVPVIFLDTEIEADALSLR